MILVAFCVLLPLTMGYEDDRCTNSGGVCQTDSMHCSGQYQSGLCGGPADRRCCVDVDHGCTSQGGLCQTDSNPCSGNYVSGLCSGAADRRCCVPGSATACTTMQKNLAYELFHSANVMAFQSHPSGEHDNAYPYNNLHDMCLGLKASRSSYSCNGCYAPGGQVCLSLTLLRYLVDLKNHGKIIINELAGACHSCQSRHYSGLAVDLHNDGRSAEYLSKCQTYHGYGQDEGNHIHCQFYDGTHLNGF